MSRPRSDENSGSHPGKRRQAPRRRPPPALWAAVLLLCFAADIVVSLGGDPVPRGGRGYGSRYAGEGIAPPVRFGFRRVAHNFRHFFVYWRPPAAFHAPKHLWRVLGADGNPPIENLFGHYGLAVLLCLTALAAGAGTRGVLFGATALNIWHEYVAEGLYCDPSWIDLWLDTAGILTALALYGVHRHVFSRRVQAGRERD